MKICLILVRDLSIFIKKVVLLKNFEKSFIELNIKCNIESVILNIFGFTIYTKYLFCWDFHDVWKSFKNFLKSPCVGSLCGFHFIDKVNLGSRVCVIQTREREIEREREIFIDMDEFYVSIPQIGWILFFDKWTLKK